MSIRSDLELRLATAEAELDIRKKALEVVLSEVAELRSILGTNFPRGKGSCKGASAAVRKAAAGGATINPRQAIKDAGLNPCGAVSIARSVGLVRVGRGQWRYPDGLPEEVKP